MFNVLFLALAASAQPMPAFMAGCWDQTRGEDWTQECWMEPRGGLMLGASRQGKGTKLSSWEQMRVEQAADGKIVLASAPEGGPAVAFAARTLSPTTAEFTNATHDYPQRIRYELKGEMLEAEISLIDGSKAIRWTYVREKP